MFDFSLCGNCATTCTHLIYCTIFPFLDHYNILSAESCISEKIEYMFIVHSAYTAQCFKIRKNVQMREVGLFASIALFFHF